MIKYLRIYLFFMLLLALSNTLHAGKIKRAFEALSVYNYFKAKVLFEKKWEKNKTAASYGLSVIYGRNDNPFHNLDSAHMYITLAVSNFSSLDEKDKMKIAEFGVDSLKIVAWKDTIDAKSFRQAVKVNTVKGFEDYMLAHFDSDYKNRAEQLRDSLVYDSTQVVGTSKAFLAFRTSYPDSHLESEALYRYQTLLFQELVDKNDLMAYRNFVKQFPNHPNTPAAEDSVYTKSIEKRNIEEFMKFILLNPTNQNVGKAWRSIYKLFTANYSAEIIQDFMQRFPDYPFKEELKQDFTLANELFLPFKKNGFWGFMNTSGTIKIPAKYTFVESFSEGLALAGLGDKVGYIDKLGETVIPFEFDEAYSFHNGLAIVGKGLLFGVINRVNGLVVSMNYEFIESFQYEIALAAKESGYGFISDSGKELTAFDFSYSTNFVEGFAVVAKEGKMAILDISLQQIIPFSYQKLTEPIDSLMIAKGDSLFGIINLNGDTILEFKYDRIDDFSGELALVQKGNKYGYANKSGKVTIPIMYTYSLPASVWGKFEGGYAKFQRNGKFGVLNTKGKEVSPSIFENLKDFNLKELFPVKKKEKWGYANGELQLKIKYVYNSAEPFYNGKAIVKNDTAFGLIDPSAKWLMQPKYKSLERVSDSIFIAKQAKVGIVNHREEIILPLEYEMVQVVNDEMMRVFKGEDVFYFNLKEEELILPKQ